MQTHLAFNLGTHWLSRPRCMVFIINLIECSAHVVACIMFTVCTEQSVEQHHHFLSSMTGHCAELIPLADLNLLLQNGSTVFNQAISQKRECCGAEYQHCHDLV